ncbi:MAG: hypothetical protein AAFO04_21025 [Cyanobacteria bacterium J06592_8]|nr:hypothetical protein [Cyanobacteriota bacterium]
MNEYKTLTLQLSPENWASLEAQAKRVNISPEILANQLISCYLPHAKVYMTPHDALKGLCQVRQSSSQTDAVDIIRYSRQELEERGIF